LPEFAPNPVVVAKVEATAPDKGTNNISVGGNKPGGNKLESQNILPASEDFQDNFDGKKFAYYFNNNRPRFR
jgi:hypothetical protein